MTNVLCQRRGDPRPSDDTEANRVHDCVKCLADNVRDVRAALERTASNIRAELRAALETAPPQATAQGALSPNWRRLNRQGQCRCCFCEREAIYFHDAGKDRRCDAPVCTRGVFASPAQPAVPERPVCDTPGCGREIPVGGEGNPEICPTCLAKPERPTAETSKPSEARETVGHDRALEALHAVNSQDVSLSDIETVERYIRERRAAEEEARRTLTNFREVYHQYGETALERDQLRASLAAAHELAQQQGDRITALIEERNAAEVRESTAHADVARLTDELAETKDAMEYAQATCCDLGAQLDAIKAEREKYVRERVDIGNRHDLHMADCAKRDADAARLREELESAKGLLSRVVKYAREDRAVTPRSTRLLRLFNLEVMPFLAKEAGATTGGQKGA